MVEWSWRLEPAAGQVLRAKPHLVRFVLLKRAGSEFVPVGDVDGNGGRDCLGEIVGKPSSKI